MFLEDFAPHDGRPQPFFKAGSNPDVLFLVNAQGLASPLTSRSAAGQDPVQPSTLIERMLGLRAAELIHRLHRAIEAAVSERRGGVLLWRNAYDDSPGRLLIITPARGDCAIVCVGALDAMPSLPGSDVVAELFGLSPSEADIALGVMRDEGLSQIAERRGVQLETVRGQVKSLLRKMGLSSQKQLIRVLTRLAVAVE
jgi:DNA-binding CsgD family transcriptional regulator